MSDPISSHDEPRLNGHSSAADRAAVSRADINKANAQHSTGPRTTVGKQRSSLNALRHGLTGQVVVLPTEDLDAYQRHAQAFLEEYRPQGATEAQLVQILIDTSWRLNRAAAVETNLFSLGITENQHRVEAGHPQAGAALAMALAFREHNRVFANLGMYVQRLSRQFERSLLQLRQLQAERRANEQDQLDNASKILKMHNAAVPSDQPEPYNPAEDGFVFSVDQIEDYSRKKERAGQAYLYYINHA